MIILAPYEISRNYLLVLAPAEVRLSRCTCNRKGEEHGGALPRTRAFNPDGPPMFFYDPSAN